MDLKAQLLRVAEKIFPTRTVKVMFDEPGVSKYNSPTPTPTKTPSRSRYEEAYKKGWEHFGNPPAATLSGMMLDAGDLYDVYKKYPFLPAAISILESGGGKNMTKRKDVSQAHRDYNITNWGINLPQGQFEPKSVEEVLSKTISGIGGRMAAYEPFRESLDLNDLGNVYAPSSDNPETGGNKYAENLRSVMSAFEQYLK